MYPKVKHKIPDPFLEKIEVDNLIDTLVVCPVVDLDAFREAKVQQRLSRYSCMELIKRQRGSGGTAGSGR